MPATAPAPIAARRTMPAGRREEAAAACRRRRAASLRRHVGGRRHRDTGHRRAGGQIERGTGGHHAAGRIHGLDDVVARREVLEGERARERRAGRPGNLPGHHVPHPHGRVRQRPSGRVLRDAGHRTVHARARRTTTVGTPIDTSATTSASASNLFILESPFMRGALRPPRVSRPHRASDTRPARLEHARTMVLSSDTGSSSSPRAHSLYHR